MYSTLTLILIVQDMDRSTSFYRDVVGLPVKMTSSEWTAFDVVGVELGLHPQTDRQKVTPGSMSFGFNVADIAATLATLRARGAVVAWEISEPYARLAGLHDPDGYEIVLCQPAAWAAGSPTVDAKA